MYIEKTFDVLNHWHPVLRTSALKHKPISITIHGKEIVIFKTKSGSIVALEDRCCHRGMLLSKGWVEGESLVCPYHTWKYDSCGNVTSPSNPTIKACIESFEVTEKYNAIWIRKNSESKFPELDIEGYNYVSTLENLINAPMELVLDIFSEVEHTVTTHAFIGYSLESIETHIDVNESSVKVSNKGTQRRIPWIIEKLTNIHSGDYVFDDWETRFSPVYSIYNHWWLKQRTGIAHDLRFYIAVFFIPINEQETKLITFFFSTKFWGSLGFEIVKPIFSFLVNYEINQDRKMLENLANKNTSTDHMVLGKFDRVLIENRKKIKQIYLDLGSASNKSV